VRLWLSVLAAFRHSSPGSLAKLRCRKLRVRFRRSQNYVIINCGSNAVFRGGSASAQLSEMPRTPTSEAEQIALDAYVYGYSLITTEVTRVQMSNVDKVEGMHAPTGQFVNIKRYPCLRLRPQSPFECGAIV
jgi:hypothetical protein